MISQAEFVGLERQTIGLLENISIEEMQIIEGVNTAVNEEWKQFYSVPRKLILDTCGEMLGSYQSLSGAAVLVVFAIAFAAGTILKKKEILFVSLCTYCFVWAVTGYCVWNERFIERVAHPLYLMAALLMVAVLLTEVKEVKPDGFTVVCYAGLLVVLLTTLGVYQVKQFMVISEEYRVNNGRWTAVNSLAVQDSENVYLIDASLIPNTASLLNEKSVTSVNQVWMTNWLVKSPIWNKQKERLGLGDIRTSFAEDSRVKLLTAIGWDYEWFYELVGEDKIESADNEAYGVTVLTGK